MNWWNKATTEQKLAQVEGCIECGMTARQASLALGVGYSALWHFAKRQHLKFRPDLIGKSFMRQERDGAVRGFEFPPVDTYLKTGVGLNNKLAWGGE